MGYRLQAADVAATQGGTGFDFNPHHAPRTVFQHDVHFLPGGGAPVKEFRLEIAPDRMAAIPYRHCVSAWQHATSGLTMDESSFDKTYIMCKARLLAREPEIHENDFIN